MTSRSQRDSGRTDRPAAGARIIVSGISIAAGMGLVGSMALSAPAPPGERQVVRVVVLPSDANQQSAATAPSPVAVPPPALAPPAQLIPIPGTPTTVTQGS